MGVRAAHRRRHHRDRLDHPVRPLLRAARRRPRRRGRQRAQGDRGLQPLRLPVDAQAARLADRPGHRIAACRRWARSRSRDGAAVEDDRRARAHADGVRRRRRRAAHPGADRRRDVRGRARIPPPRGQAVLVGAFRPAQQSRRRMGRQQRRVPRRAAEVVTDWHLPPHAPASRSAGCGCTARSPPAGSDRACTRSTTRPPRPAWPTIRTGARSGNGRRSPACDDPDAPDRGRHLSSGNPRTADASTQLPFALTPGAPIPTDEAARVRSTTRPPTVAAGLPRPAADARHRHPAAARPTHPQRRAAARTRPTSPRTSPPRCSTSTRPTSPCTGRRAPARRTPRPGHRQAGQRAPLAGRRRRAVACGGGEPVPRPDRGGRGPGAGRQEGRTAPDARWQDVDEKDYAAFIADQRRLRDRRHRMGFRQRQPGGRAAASTCW